MRAFWISRNFGGFERRDGEAALLELGDELFRRQTVQRLAQGHGAKAVALLQIGDRELGARFEMTGDEIVADAVIGFRRP